MCDLTDPLDLLRSKAELEEAKAKLEAFDKGDRTCSAEELWKAQKIWKSMTHPVTGEVTFAPGRMCAFVATNTPVAMGMIIHGPTSVAAGAFWQWMNQSINAACNYVNRSGADVDMVKIAQSYGLAVSSSCAIAIGAGKFIAARPALQNLGMLLPYFAVITASTANMVFTRFDELQRGVPVFDPDNKDVGLSRKAGFQGVVQTLVTRAYLGPMAALLIPPVGILVVRKAAPRMMQNFLFRSVTEASIIAGSIYLTLPVFLAIQPQIMVLPRETLEPEFHNLVDKNGKEVTQFHANKGL
eukprot:GEMP01036833.1.p1 GENE.GEMP01036833.1~~GEMP01036833.1.p1  ORF type:complete len:298 (+),score=43.58 GEMP01036833.1:318-1211(+)